MVDLPRVTLPGGVDTQHGAYQSTFIGRANPAFDPRRYSTNPWYANLQQGLLVQDKPSTSGQIEKLRFLYNPSDYNIAYAASNSLLPTNVDDPTNDASIVGAVQTNTAFSLLFDRSYELYDGNTLLQAAQGKTPYAQPAGVDADILAFRRLVGIPDDQNGMMLYVPVHLYLGGPNAPHFFGIITSASVAYTHFSTNMIPMRAVISIDQMTQYLLPSDTSAPPPTGTPPPPGTPAPAPAPAPAPGTQPGPSVASVVGSSIINGVVGQVLGGIFK